MPGSLSINLSPLPSISALSDRAEPAPRPETEASRPKEIDKLEHQPGGMARAQLLHLAAPENLSRGWKSKLATHSPYSPQRDFYKEVKPHIKRELLNLRLRAFENGRKPSEETVAGLRNEYKDFLRHRSITEGGSAWKKALEYFDTHLKSEHALHFTDTILAGERLGLPYDVRRSTVNDRWELTEEIRPAELKKYVAEVKALLQSQPWFHHRHAIGELTIGSVRSFPAPEEGEQLLLLATQVRFIDGRDETWSVPVRIDGDGRLSDGLQSQAFKDELVEAARRGEQLVPDAYPLHVPRPKAFRAPVWLTQRMFHGKDKLVLKSSPSELALVSAKENVAELEAVIKGEVPADVSRWGELITHNYTTRARFELVSEQIKDFSPKYADILVEAFFDMVLEASSAIPEKVREYQTRMARQNKFTPVFYGYTESIAVPKKGENGTMYTLSEALPMFRSDFNFKSVQLMPIAASPGRDGNYDISDHRKIRDELGGEKGFDHLLGEIMSRDMMLTTDGVFNHVSNEHEWFKKLEAGDESMAKRFVTWNDAVKVGQSGDHNVFLHMKGENAGKLSLAEPSFPDNNPDSMLKIKVNGREYKIFISFMNPYQPDIEIKNPEVFKDILKTIAFVLTKGQLGLRLDAVLHMGKEPGKVNFNLPSCLSLVKILKSFANHIAPGNVFVPEVPLDWNETRTWIEGSRSLDGDGLRWDVGADSPVGFPVQKAIVNTVLTGEKTAWMNVQEELGEVEPGTSAFVYIGSHDEMMVGKEMHKALLDKGLNDFAGRGVGDSVATLLDNNADRLAMLHALLYSSKGHPMVYYRTLVGAKNDVENFKKKIDERMKAQQAAGMEVDLKASQDTRDLDRGPIYRDAYESALSSGYKPAVFVRALNALWEKNSAVRSNILKPVNNPDSGIVSMAHLPEQGDEALSLLQLFNLTGEEKTVELDLAEVEEKLGRKIADDGSLLDVLHSEIARDKDANAEVRVACEIDGASKVKIRMAPYAAHYLQ